MSEVYEINTKGRDFVIGDLHGCYDLFLKLLDDIKFDKENDRMFSVGDLIDRGDKNIECLKLIEKPWFHCVMGNHEKMMVDAVLKQLNVELWLQNGGNWSIGHPVDELIDLACLAKLLPYSITVQAKDGDIGICHAQPPSLKWEDVKDPDERSKQIMLWARMWIEDKDMEDVEGVNMTIHGHTPVDKPEQIGNVLFIDTGAVFTGNLTCIQL